MKLFRVLAALCMTTVLALPAAAQTAPASTAPADVLGSWDVNWTTQQGPIQGSLKLKKDGEKLAGTVGSQMGEMPIEAEIKGKDLSVWFNFQGQGGAVPIEMLGKVDGDKITGTFTAGGQPAGEWTATRAKDASARDTAKEPSAEPAAAAPAKVNLTGDWNLSVELPNMTATPALTLKQDGDKLTGDYVSAQYGKFPLKGTVKGSEVSFTFTMSVEGTGMDVTYTGAVDKDGKMAGSVNYGDMMSGRFTATKKK